MEKTKRILARVLRVDGLESNANDRIVLFGVCLAAFAVGLRLFFWWYTRRDWEDALITVLHSENFVHGLGLTHYRVGEPPVHGFTSPLSVLVPLVGDVLGGAGFGLSFIKLVSAFVGGLAVLYAMAIAIHPRVRLPQPLAVLVMCYVACEHHQILWGMAGMETQMATAILLMSIYFTIAMKPTALGISLGLCMLVRPDYAFWTLIAGVCVLAWDRRAFVRVVAIALALYLPWIVFTTWYYGSPIPNTLLAKAYGYPVWHVNPDFISYLNFEAITGINRLKLVMGSYQLPNLIFQTLGPCFAGQGSHFGMVYNDRALICDAMVLLACLGGAALVWRRQWGLVPVLAFVIVYTSYYVSAVGIIYGWYVVPLAAATLFLSARGIEAITGWIGRRLRTIVQWGFAIAYLVSVLGILPWTIHAEKRIQEDIEDVVRKPMGLYLNRVMRPDETVGTECLGYVAYYSRRTVYDWPGLASKTAYQYTRTHPNQRLLLDMMRDLKPDFIVIRYLDYALCPKDTWLDSEYRIAASFETSWERTRDILDIKSCGEAGFFVLVRWDRPPRTDDSAAETPGIAPNHSRAYNSLACRLANQGKLAEAIVQFEQARAIDPNFADPHSYLGEAYQVLGQWDRAIDAYSEAIRLDPSFLLKDGIQLARLLTKQNRGEEAAAYYGRLADAFPKEIKILFEWGNALIIAGKIEETVALYQEVLRQDPANAEAYFNIAVVMEALGKLDEAIEYYRKTLVIEPENLTLRERLGKALVEKEQREKEYPK